MNSMIAVLPSSGVTGSRLNVPKSILSENIPQMRFSAKESRCSQPWLHPNRKTIAAMSISV